MIGYIELGVGENPRHLIMQCPFVSVEQNLMIQVLNKIDPGFERHGALGVIMEGEIPGVDIDSMGIVWKHACKHVYSIYLTLLMLRLLSSKAQR